MTDEPQVAERRAGADPRAELAVAVLLVLAGLAAAAFAVLIVADPQTQLLGATLGVALACLAAAAMLAAKRVVVREVAVEERRREDTARPEDDAGLAEDLRRGGDGITRRRALGAAAGVAGAGLAGALVVPVTALGPGLGDAPNQTPWRRGRRLVTTDGEALRADAIEIGSFASALPEGPTSASSARRWSSCASIRAR